MTVPSAAACSSDAVTSSVFQRESSAVILPQRMWMN